MFDLELARDIASYMYRFDSGRVFLSTLHSSALQERERERGKAGLHTPCSGRRFALSLSPSLPPSLVHSSRSRPGLARPTLFICPYSLLTHSLTQPLVLASLSCKVSCPRIAVTIHTRTYNLGEVLKLISRFQCRSERVPRFLRVHLARPPSLLSPE